MNEKRPVRLRSVASWYYGNYCSMRCLREEGNFKRLSCYKRIREFMEDRSNNDKTITHRDFMRLVREELKLCDTRNFKKPEFHECPICTALGVPQRRWWY